MLDFETITAWMQANQFLTGGIGTVAFGSAMYLIRSTPRKIVELAGRTLTTTFTITTRYRQYEEVALLLGRSSLPLMMRNFAPNQSREENEPRRGGRRSGTPSNLAPGYGRGWAVYKGTLVTFHRSMMESKGDIINEEISVRFMTRNVRIVEAFLREAEAMQDEDRVKIHVSQGDWFGQATKKPKRSLDSVFVSRDTKNSLVKALEEFLCSEETYAERGIPYKLCAVLHGPPGTGKTSLVHAIASHFDLSINYVTSLANIDGLVSECRAGDLLVIEDIDALAADLKRKGKDDDEDNETSRVIPTSVLHKLLNAIDGFCTPHGLKVLITTNHPEKLDPALLRPGRTDLMLEIGPIGGSDLRAMFEAFYGPGSSLMLEGLEIEPQTGSRLQQIFASHPAGKARDILLSDGSAHLHEFKQDERSAA